MDALKQAIREALAGGAEYVLAYGRDGHRKEAVPMKIRSAEEADKAVFDRTCRQNLAVLLPKKSTAAGPTAGPKVGIVAKACDVRSIIVLMQEEMVDRDSIHIIGVTCPGVDDREGPAPRCAECRDNVPALHDALIETGAEAARKDSPFDEVVAFEQKTPAERWEYWQEQFSKCRRCYACRQACPLCYCDECLIDRARPQLIDESVKPSSNLAFHLMRAYHLAGRCVDCGACQSACPEGLPIRLLNRKMAKDVLGMFGHTAGLDPQAKPPLVTLSKTDPDGILKGGLASEQSGKRI